MWRSALAGLGIALMCFLAGCESREDAREREKVCAAYWGVRAVGNAVEAYYVATGEWPKSLKQLTVADPEKGLKATLRPEQIIDPWGSPYQYVPPPSPHNGETGPDVFTIAPRDGRMLGNWREK
jgi:hypothetical protein